MKVWITKYALSLGILVKDATVCEAIADGSMIEVKVDQFGGQYFHGEGRDWHKTEEAAIARAIVMANKKIESLKKQKAKVEKAANKWADQLEAK